jgi:hypothetical protein
LAASFTASLTASSQPLGELPTSSTIFLTTIPLSHKWQGVALIKRARLHSRCAKRSSSPFWWVSAPLSAGVGWAEVQRFYNNLSLGTELCSLKDSSLAVLSIDSKTADETVG